MKFLFAIILAFYTYQAQASNACFGIVSECTEINNCNLNCQATLREIMHLEQSMQDVWQTTIRLLKGNWTVVQTKNANWYSNWSKAAVCTCGDTETIFVQQ